MHHVSNVKMFIVLKCIISLYYDIQIYTKIYPPSPLLFDYNNIIFWTFWNLWVYRYYFISYVSIKQLIQISQLISNGAHVTSYSHNESILLIRIWILIAGGKVLSILSSLDVSSFTSLQYIGLPPRGFLWLNCMGCFTEIIFLFFFCKNSMFRGFYPIACKFILFMEFPFFTEIFIWLDIGECKAAFKRALSIHI